MLIFAGVGLICGAKRDSVMALFSGLYHMNNGYERERVGYSKVDQGYYHQGETQGTPMNQTHFREKVNPEESNFATASSATEESTFSL
mmetsp:Transcript_20880/g.48453  ORF Transcript_20880/g.48453 Transcript_20880/m.48453 type:complete len:88 (-) Transcript_20880:154-417(-)